MQPPQNLAPKESLSIGLIDRLLNLSEESLTLHEQRSREELALKKLEAEALRARFEPLEDQIRRWWANLPEADKHRRFHITEIAAHCRGKYQERPALRDVAASLRLLGWRSMRSWKKFSRDKRFWNNPS
jgi:hypothetical protein